MAGGRVTGGLMTTLVFFLSVLDLDFAIGPALSTYAYMAILFCQLTQNPSVQDKFQVDTTLIGRKSHQRLSKYGISGIFHDF